MQKYTFDNEVNRYVSQVNSLKKTLPPIIQSVNTITSKAYNDFLEFVKHNSIKDEDHDQDSDRFVLPKENFFKIKKLLDEIDNFTIASKIIPESFIVSLISQYDAYLGRIIKTMFLVKPEMLNASEKSIKFSHLIKYNSIDEIKESIIEKEIETILRKSHTEQFDWLENKLNIPLRKDLNSWPCFIEVTERRNLFVHCNGEVSSQYISVCKDHKVNLSDEIKLGHILDVNSEYFDNSYNCVFAIGIKLAQVIWRKLIPTDIENADNNLNNICYTLLCNEEYDLAQNLLEFAVKTLKKYSSEEMRLYFTINLCLAYKLNGLTKKCDELLKKNDWTARSDKFKIAYYVLLDNFGEAANIMVKIGISEDVVKQNYEEWPLFKEFVKTDIFRTTYKQVFDEEFEGDTNKISEEIEHIKNTIDEAATIKEQIIKKI